jgi:hypothetical protein
MNDVTSACAGTEMVNKASLACVALAIEQDQAMIRIQVAAEAGQRCLSAKGQILVRQGTVDYIRVLQMPLLSACIGS